MRQQGALHFVIIITYNLHVSCLDNNNVWCFFGTFWSHSILCHGLHFLEMLSSSHVNQCFMRSVNYRFMSQEVAFFIIWLRCKLTGPCEHTLL